MRHIHSAVLASASVFFVGHLANAQVPPPTMAPAAELPAVDRPTTEPAAELPAVDRPTTEPAPAPGTSTPASPTVAAGVTAARSGGGAATGAGIASAPAASAPATPTPPDAKPATDKPWSPTPQPAESKWKLNIYGIAEFNAMLDSTQSFPDSGIGGTAIRRDDTTPFEAKNTRLHFTVRNSRLGFKASAPEFQGMKASANIELDFFGVNWPSEGAMMSSATFRLRMAWVKLETPYVDILAGQTYHLFGWMPYFYPCTVSFFPMPNMAFGRQAQFRLSHTFKTAPLNIDVAVAAVRPPQSAAGVPDLQGGLKFGINGWKGVHSLGAGSAVHDPLSFGVSGVKRQFRVTALEAGASTRTNTASGYGVSIDAFIPIIPASSREDRGNALSLTGSFVAGTGIGDLGGFLSGPPWPAPPNPTGATPAPTYTANIDNSAMVMYDTGGSLHSINWRGYMAGIQYYLPPAGRAWVGVNYTHGESNNIVRYLDPSAFTTAYKEARYIDASLFFDVTPAVRTGLLYGNYQQVYCDGIVAQNHRGEFSAYYLF